MQLTASGLGTSRNEFVVLALLTAIACAGPVGKAGPPGPGSDGGNAAASIDYGVMTPAELQAANMTAVFTGVTIPADGRPVVTVKVTERHGSGVRGMSATAVSWRFALIKLTQGVNGSANDTWVSYMAANDHSATSTETAAGTALTDNGDGTYNYQFTRVVTAGGAAAGTVYEPSKVHRLILVLSASGTPFTPINLVKEFIPATGADVTGQNDKVDGAACLECHTQFRAIAGEVGKFGTGQFHGGVRYDIRTCAACHNDQKRFAASGTAIDSPSVAADGTWAGNMLVLNNEAYLNLPVFIHKIHMGEDLTMKGGTYQGFPKPYEVTYPQDVRNCVKCHRSPAPLADNWKNQPSQRACGACHDDISFVNPPPNGRKLHTGGAVSVDTSCALCHAAGAPAGDIPSMHVAVSPPNPLNIYKAPTAVGATSNTNAAFVAAAGTVPPGANVVTYDVKSVSTWVDADPSHTPLNATRPQIVFKLKLDGVDVVFPDPLVATELIPNFVGAPSAYFSFAVPQDGKNTPADYNASGSAYIRNVWNNTGTCSNVAASATTAPTGAGILTGPDTSGYYTLKLTCVVIPTGGATTAATMLIGGIGYTYSLGSVANPANPALDFKNNNQPLTQIKCGSTLPGTTCLIETPSCPPPPAPGARCGYQYVPNANGQAGQGGLIVPAPDISKAATGFTARRAIVANSKCNGCHVQLGVGPDFHAGQRNDAGTCNFCHKPNQTSTGWSANMKDFVHALHGAEKRGVQFTWHEKSPTKGYWQTTYPAVLNRCEMCHLAGTYDFSLLPTTAAPQTATTALPNMLSSTAGAGTYANGSVHSPYVSEAAVTPTYGSVFSFNALTGVSTEAAPTTLVISPIMAACSACHDSPAAVDHMKTNGGSFWEARSAVSAKPQKEECLICHGPNRIAAISLVHLDRTP